MRPGLCSASQPQFLRPGFLTSDLPVTITRCCVAVRKPPSCSVCVCFCVCMCFLFKARKCRKSCARHPIVCFVQETGCSHRGEAISWQQGPSRNPRVLTTEVCVSHHRPAGSISVCVCVRTVPLLTCQQPPADVQSAQINSVRHRSESFRNI